MPTPRLRSGGRTYEIRIRVPQEARGGRFKATHTTRTLSTPDRKADNEGDAYRNLPMVYDALQADFEEEATKLIGNACQQVNEAHIVAKVDPTFLTIDDVCRRYRKHILRGEQQARLEYTYGAQANALTTRYDPVALAESYSARVKDRLVAARAERVIRDFRNQEWFVTYLEKKGVGRVSDRGKAIRALCEARIRALQLIINDDAGVVPNRQSLRQRPKLIQPQQPIQAQSAAPLFSDFAEDFIARRGASISGERADSYRAIVRDLVEVTADKPVTHYTIEDADAFETVLRSLPANWRKKSTLRDLSIDAAAKKAKAKGLAPQSPTTIRNKWTRLGTIFKHASHRYDFTNRFHAEILQIDKASSDNEQRDPFTEQELAELMASELNERLRWLTWLGLYTGARLNELCQLRTDHIKKHDGLHYIYFSPELRLKTGEKESCVRSVPLRREIIDAGFLDHVDQATDLLFPDIPQHTSGRYSDAPSKAFSYHLKKIDIKRPRLSYHSLRHTFLAEFKRYAARDFETRERLVGHAVTGVAGRYGNSYEAEALDMELLVERAKVLKFLKFNY